MKTVVTPGVGWLGGSQVNYVHSTGYNYVDSAGGYHSSPTQTTYHYTDGSSKTSTTVYDAMDRAVSTTDANGRTISYAYDTLGRQTMTAYQGTVTNPVVFTQNNYSCCTLDSSVDENGNTTHYIYDSDNRLTETYTDISGQGANAPLVAYTYDSFGNQQTVITRSDANTTRTTTYTYDANNRVTKIVYPDSTAEGDLIADEFFQYDSLGNLVAKLQGVVDTGKHIVSGSVTAYGYDSLNRPTQVKYNYGYTPNTTLWPLSSISISGADVTYGYSENGVDSGGNLEDIDGG